MPYRYLLTCPTIVAACCAGFASYWGLALGLTWFTSYLVDGLGFSQKVGGNLSILPWVFGLVVVLAGGYISQRLKIERRLEPPLPRRLRGGDGHPGRLHPAFRRAGVHARGQDRAAGLRRGDRQHDLRRACP